MYEMLTTKKDHVIPTRKPIPNRPRKNCVTLMSPAGAHAVSFMGSDHNLSHFYDRQSDLTYLEQCFEVLSCIGYGCFGVVFKVNSLEDGKLYAVKKSRERFRNAVDKKRKLVEVERLEKLAKHPNCIQMHRAWEEDGHLFLQLELCEVSLAKYTMSHHKIPEEMIWNILTDITLALKHLHDQNILHLDIKLDNILMSADGSFKLSDFGISLDCSQKFGDIADGDAKYIAPEVLTENVSKSADIFSLGISIYELSFDVNLPICGELWQQLRKGQVSHLGIDTISKNLFELMKWMMHPDPDKRPTADIILQHTNIKRILLRRKISHLMEALALSGKLLLSFFSFYGRVGYDMVLTALLKLIPLSQDSPLGMDSLGISGDEKKDGREDGVATSTPKTEKISKDIQMTPIRLGESWEVSECFDPSVDISDVNQVVSPSEAFLKVVLPDSGCKRCKNIRSHPYDALVTRKCRHCVKKHCSTVRNLFSDFSGESL